MQILVITQLLVINIFFLRRGELFARLFALVACFDKAGEFDGMVVKTFISMVHSHLNNVG